MVQIDWWIEGSTVSPYVLDTGAVNRGLMGSCDAEPGRYSPSPSNSTGLP